MFPFKGRGRYRKEELLMNSGGTRERRIKWLQDATESMKEALAQRAKGVTGDKWKVDTDELVRLLAKCEKELKEELEGKWVGDTFSGPRYCMSMK